MTFIIKLLIVNKLPFVSRFRYDICLKDCNMKPLHLTSALLFCLIAHAQLSPPGLGETHSAYWSAAGIRQKLNEKNTSVTYVGTGHISGPHDENPLDKPSIFVVNEEIYHKINPAWQYSYALSYRRQHHYSHLVTNPDDAEIHQEYRAYARLSHSTVFGDFKWKNTLRQEVRKFFNPEFGDISNSLQLRTRLKTQITAGLDATKTNSISATAEALFSIAHDATANWGDYEYKESRFCLYYTYKPKDMPVTFDLGYMNDLAGKGHEVIDANYIAFDIILENPF